MIRRLSLFAFFIVAGLSPVLWAAEELSAEPQHGASCMVQNSPFYQKLLAAGIFDVPMAYPENPKPLILLFRMAKNFHYDSDGKGMDDWQSADQTLKSYSGDCEDKAIWLYTQLRKNGFENTSLHIGRYASDSRKFHMWVTVSGVDGTILLDPTNQRKPWPESAFPKKSYRSLHIICGESCVSL